MSFKKSAVSVNKNSIETYYQRFAMGALSLIMSLLLIGCGQGNEQGFAEAVELNQQNIVSLTVTGIGNSSRVKVGNTQAFEARGVVSGSTDTIDLTSRVHWRTDDVSVVTINGSGVATGVADGTVQVIASFADLSASTSLKSSSADVASVVVTNSNTGLSVCDTASAALVATATFTDGDTDDITVQAEWTSSDANAVFVGNSSSSTLARDEKGKISALTTAGATVTAAYEGQNGDIAISVNDDLDASSLQVTAPTSIFVDTANTYAFTATATYGGDSTDRRDVSHNVAWTSSNTDALEFASGDNQATAKVEAASVDVTAACGAENASVSVEVEPERVVSGFRLIYGDQTINSDGPKGTITVNLNDTSPAQMVLYLTYSNGDVIEVDVADDEETVWSFDGNESGESASISNDEGTKGEISFDAVGITEFKVRTTLGDRPEMLFYFEVQD